MLVTLSGIVMLVRLVQYSNAPPDIIFVFSFILQEVIEVSLALTRTKYGLLSFPR